MRDESIENGLTLKWEGFTAASFAERFMYDLTVKFQLAQGLNSLCRDISEVSRYKSEAEILFIPNTEFIFSKVNDRFYHATPVRSINSEVYGDLTPYQHDLSSQTMHEVNVNKVYVNLSLLNVFIKQKIKENTHSLIERFFDTVDNNKKITCLHKLTNAIDKVLLMREQGLNFSELLEDIAKSKAEHDLLIKNSLLPASPGITGAIFDKAIRTILELESELSLNDNLIGFCKDAESIENISEVMPGHSHSKY